jgi:hypothetical protein
MIISYIFPIMLIITVHVLTLNNVNCLKFHAAKVEIYFDTLHYFCVKNLLFYYNSLFLRYKQ